MQERSSTEFNSARFGARLHFNCGGASPEAKHARHNLRIFRELRRDLFFHGEWHSNCRCSSDLAVDVKVVRSRKRWCPPQLPGLFFPWSNAMPYSAQISRNQPTAFIFLIDQSGSMKDTMPSGESKSQFVANVLNKAIYQMIIRCTKSNGVRDYFDLGVIAYGGNGVTSGFGGTLGQSMLHPISRVEQSPLRIDTKNKKVSDGAGGIVEHAVKFPVWLDPKNDGGTPMCEALNQTGRILGDWCNAHEQSYPPTIIHITDGESTDGDPETKMGTLQRLSTSDGECLLFNLHIDATEGDEKIFPDREADLPDSFSKMLFRSSSHFPAHLITEAQSLRYPVSSASKFFGYRAGAVQIVDFVNIGTQTSYTNGWLEFDAER